MDIIYLLIKIRKVTDIMYQYFAECELNIQQAEHDYEVAFENFASVAADVIYKMNTGVFTESSEADDIILMEAGKFVEAVKKFFATLIESVKKFFSDVSQKWNIEMQKREVNAKLKTLKQQLAQNKIVNAKDVEVFDTQKYMKACTEYINFVVSETKAGLNKTFKDVKELDKCQQEIDKKILKKISDLGLDDDSVFILNMSINDAIVYTEKEMANFEANTKLVAKAIEDSIRAFEGMASNLDDTERINEVKAKASEAARMANKCTKKAQEGILKRLGKIIGMVKGDSGKDKED